MIAGVAYIQHAYLSANLSAFSGLCPTLSWWKYTCTPPVPLSSPDLGQTYLYSRVLRSVLPTRENHPSVPRSRAQESARPLSTGSTLVLAFSDSPEGKAVYP